MRTVTSGALSLSSFVASSPSMPGMRTSMITTSGFRRSASADAFTPVLGELLEEMLSRAGAGEERVRPPPRGPGLACGLDRFSELLVPIGDAGQTRREADSGLDSGVDEPRHGPHALVRVRRGRLCLPPDRLVERRDRERDGDACPARGFDEDVDVADDHRPARDDAE